MSPLEVEAAVIGGTLGATVTAALLAHRGIRGVLIDQGELAGAGTLLDLVPSEEASEAITGVHREIGFGDVLRRIAKPIEPALQVVFPDERLDVPREREAFLLELGRTLGATARDRALAILDRVDALEKESGELLAEIAPIPPRGFWARRAAKAAARRHEAVTVSLSRSEILAGAEEPLSRLLLGGLPFVTHLDARSVEEASVARFVRPFARVLRGLGRLDGGRSLRSLFTEHAKGGGFDVIRDAVAKIQPGKRIFEIALVEGRRPYRAVCLIDASSDLSGLDAIPRASASRALAAAIQDARPQGHLHALVLDVAEDVLPPGMAENVLLLNGRTKARDHDPDDRPILLVRRAGAPGRVRLVALHPLSEAEGRAESVDDLDMVIRARIERLVPFLAEGDLRSGREASLRLVGHALYDPGLDPIAGITGTGWSTPVKQLLVAGPSVVPGLGVEGQYLSAIQVADEVERIVRGKKHPRTLVRA